jgi:hypothetical protein
VDAIGWRGRHFSFYAGGMEDVCATPVEEFRRLDKDGFRAFIPLCQGGANIDLIEEEVLEPLRQHNCTEALAVAFIFAGRVLKRPEDLQRLERKRNMVDDLLKDNPIYQKMMEEATERVEKNIRAEDIEAMVRARFPELLAFVKSRLASLVDLSKLEEIVVLVGTARTADEVRESLLALP